MYAVVDAGVYHDGVGALVCQFDGGVGGRGGRGRRGRCLDDAGRARHWRLGGAQDEWRRTRPGAPAAVGFEAGDGRRRVQGGRRTELFRVALVSQPAVDVAATAQQDLLERRAEVAVETGVDDRVQKAVGEAEPQEQTGQPLGDVTAVARLLAERSDQSQYEERQPAGGERSHNYAESLRHLHRHAARNATNTLGLLVM